MVATREGWETVVAGIKADGTQIPDLPYEEMKRFVESGEYSLSVDLGQNFFVTLMIQSLQPMLYHLSRRRWYLTVVAPDAPDLICSDNPVSILATPMSPLPDQLGFAMPGTLLLFPLNRRMALVGSFEGFMLPNPAPEKTVALINGATGRNTERFLFSSTADFIWVNHDKEIRRTADLLAYLRGRVKDV